MASQQFSISAGQTVPVSIGEAGGTVYVSGGAVTYSGGSLASGTVLYGTQSFSVAAGSDSASVQIIGLTPSSGNSVDADGTTKGVVKLAGDLGGTAALPTVPGLATKVDGTKTTKRATLVMGGPGHDGGTMPTSGNVNEENTRQRGILPVTPKRYRLRIKNYSTFTLAAGGAGVDYKGSWIGEPDPPTAAGDNRWAGALKTATQIVNVTQTLDGTSADYVTAWIDNADGAGGIFANVPFAISSAFKNNGGVTQTIFGDKAAGWAFAAVGTSAAGVAGAAAKPSGAVTNTPAFDIRVEYEYDTYISNGRPDVPVGLFVGDSITYGKGGAYPAANVAGHQDEAWPNIAALSEGFCAVNLGIDGSSTSNWVTNLTAYLARADIATSVPDFACISLGVNDVAASATVATIEANIVTLVTALKALGIKRIYIGTIVPGGWLLDTAITATTASGVATVAMPTAGLVKGLAIAGTGIPASTTILSVDNAQQITMSANATAAGTITATVSKPASSYVNTAAKETVRTTVNDWIRPGAMGAKPWDFDRMVRLEGAPGLIDTAFISTYPHPEPNGYARMAQAVRL